MPKLSRRKIAQYWVDNYFNGKDATNNVAAYLVATKSTRRVDVLVREIESQLAERGVAVTHVVSARPLGASLRKEVEKLAKSMSGAEDIALHETVDKQVLGGVRVELPGQVLDTTLRQRLNNIKQRV